MALPLLAVALFNFNAPAVQAISPDDDATVALYKAKCQACHGPAAAKSYDPEMAIEEQVEVIMKGKKGEKPPYMPAFEAKGITTEQATALAEHMKKLRTPPE
ncbi:MAG: cytochrome c [Pyrinomonadaceae bacterium]